MLSMATSFSPVSSYTRQPQSIVNSSCSLYAKKTEAQLAKMKELQQVDGAGVVTAAVRFFTENRASSSFGFRFRAWPQLESEQNWTTGTGTQSTSSLIIHFQSFSYLLFTCFLL